MTTLLATWNEPGKVAIESAWNARNTGADLRSTLEHGLATAELDPNLVAIGFGSLPNRDGEIELDASMMDGSDLSAGAVCGLRGILPAISIARKVLEETPHVMIAGEQARRFAIEKGFEPLNLITSGCIERYNTWLESPESHHKTYVHTLEEGLGQHLGDTVTMIGLESPGHLVAASSTSGLAFKIPGRVGDSPIIGAGIYADDEVGAAGATGMGEELWKACASFRTVERMRAGMSPLEACEDTIRQMLRRQPESVDPMCVVFAMNRDGEYGAACTSGVFPLWICKDGQFEMRNYPCMTG